MPHHRWNARVAAAVAVVGLSIAACSGGEDLTGPDPDPVPAGDVVHNVSVRFDSITVTGSCDRNSIFESPNDGEFIIGIAIRLGTSTVITSNDAFHFDRDGTYPEGVHRLASSTQATFARNATLGERFSVVFAASERDGLLGNDPDMNNRSAQQVYEWRSNAWSGDGGTRVIQLSSASPDRCGVRLRYTISYVVAP